ncbi:hypothetical protein PVAG01_03467 [Phlyctema vagabunda]|uniref:Rhodopsin domain-containing protein n=1 Tax=Phlyctema vagabunda TaxID=108571 RepID=A0ABR4PLH3_9HELO
MLSHPQIVILTTSVALSFLAAVFVGLRVFTRLFVTRNAKLDDAMLLLALVGAIIFNGVATYQTLHPPRSIKSFYGVASRRVTILGFSSYVTSITATKISILLQYLRFLIEKRYRLMCWIMMAVTLSWTVVALVGAVIIRRSAEDMTSSKQSNPNTLTWVITIMNIITDFMIIIIPVPVVFSMEKISIKQKISLLALFASGTSVGIFAVIRSLSILSPNVSFEKLWLTGVWTNAELTLAVICASLPGIKPLFRCCAKPRPESTANGDKYTRDVSNSEKGLIGQRTWERTVSLHHDTRSPYSCNNIPPSSNPNPIPDNSTNS